MQFQVRAAARRGGASARLDITQVAAPTIRRELGGSYAVIEWVTAAYALAMAVGLLTGGRLGDIFGRRRMLLTGMPVSCRVGGVRRSRDGR